MKVTQPYVSRKESLYRSCQAFSDCSGNPAVMERGEGNMQTGLAGAPRRRLAVYDGGVTGCGEKIKKR